MKPISDQVNILPYFPNDKAKIDKSQPVTILPIERTPLKDDKFFEVSNNLLSNKVVYKSLSINLTHFSSSSSQLTNIPLQKINEPAESFFDYEEVANNVLNFVGGRLQEAKQQGADDQKMADLFQQARDGVAQGFAAATKELDEIGMLDDELEEGINKSRNIIDQGINSLEQRLLPENSADDTIGAIAASYYSSSFSTQENSSNLSITTAEGDRVTISFSDYFKNSQNEQFNYINSFGSQGHNSEQYSYNYTQSSYRATTFSFTIEGDLNEGEKKAIEDLIKNINQIEKSFFSGNLDDAFEKALALGFDQNELSGFNLDLRQTSSSVVSKRYNEIAQLANSADDSLAKLTQPLFDFAQQYQNANKQAIDLFENKENEFDKLINAVFKAEFGNQQEMLSRLDSFLKKIPV